MMRRVVQWVVVAACLALGILLLGARDPQENAAPSANSALALPQAATNDTTGRAEDGADEPVESSSVLEPAPAGARPLGTPRKPLALGDRGDEEEPSGLLARLNPQKSEFMRVAYALGIVLCLILALRMVIRRAAPGLAGGGRPSGVLEVLARYPYARGQQLVLLKLGRRIILMHQSASGLAALSEVTDAEEVANLLACIEAGSRVTKARSFTTALKRTEAEFEPAEPRGRHFPGGLGNASDADIIDLTRMPRRTPAPRGAAS